MLRRINDALPRLVATILLYGVGIELRYVVVVILFFILGYFNFGNLFMAFVGVLGLKVSAYLQGLIEKVKHKRSGGSDASSAEILSDYEGTE